MPGDSDTTTGAERRAAPSRRALALAGVHAAWAVPAVALATAAPAEAATSTGVGSQLVVTDATYWVKIWPAGTYGVVPHFTVTNPTSTPTAFWVTMRFSASDFIGPDRTHQPPRPTLVNTAYLEPPPWGLQVMPGSPSDDFVDIMFWRDGKLGPNESATLTVVTTNPGAINWSNNPPMTTTIPYTAHAVSAAFTDGLGFFTQMPAPASGP